MTLKDEYLKIQRKKVEGSQQRIENGTVYFTVSTPMQVLSVRTFVQRLSDWLEDFRLNRPENSKKMLQYKLIIINFIALSTLTVCPVRITFYPASVTAGENLSEPTLFSLSNSFAYNSVSCKPFYPRGPVRIKTSLIDSVLLQKEFQGNLN